MTQEAEDRVTEASDATAARLREQAEEIGFQRERAAKAESQATAWKGEADKLKTEVNDLRSQLLDALLASERLRGFIEGKRMSEPPRMVPDHPMAPDWTEASAPRYRPRYSDSPKPWFAR